jgi:hypothetical protein
VIIGRFQTWRKSLEKCTDLHSLVEPSPSISTVERSAGIRRNLLMKVERTAVATLA